MEGPILCGSHHGFRQFRKFLQEYSQFPIAIHTPHLHTICAVREGRGSHNSGICELIGSWFSPQTASRDARVIALSPRTVKRPIATRPESDGCFSGIDNTLAKDGARAPDM